MILVLHGADFSAKNIGRIDMPIEIDADIQSLLANYSKTLSNAKQGEVQRFIKTLRSSGVMSKLHGLYLPILAGQLGESFVNCIDGKTHPVTYSPSADSYQLSPYGVRRYADGNEIVLDVIGQNSGGNWSFFSLGNIEDVANQTPIPYFGSNNSCRLAYIKSSLATSAYFSINDSYVGDNVRLKSVLQPEQETPNLLDTYTINDMIICATSFVPGHVYVYECRLGESGVIDMPLATEINSTVEVFKLDKHRTQGQLYGSQSIVALGDGLTSTELLALGEASKMLRESLVN